ncbi:MAG: phenylalanine--tRNA ligase subunit beta [Thermoguttaceae bacterium]|nr:phenylalanine--tRNA ligase subunit beta [Thermoguttaceae bacterium]MDW8079816.1 phenylalanine--tRNA ligase subunit beta [Thermoguttaceae bacterium]
MKISLDWLSDFVDIADIEPERIADRLTMCTAEVEGLETIRRSVDGVLVGKITSVEIIPDVDPRLKWVVVDCGKQTYGTVCGAPNVRVGLTSAFAPPGTKLADGQTVTICEVAGRKSNGVLCSPRELGFSRWHEGIVELPASLAPGASLAEFVPGQDVLIEIDNKSLTHRPDLWGHYGFARELAAILERPLRPLPMADLSAFDHLPAIPLRVEDLEDCPCYGCLMLEFPAADPAPLIIQRRLHAVGQRTFNLAVDLTNYILWEIAQPMHAFDGELVQMIRVAHAGNVTTFVTLDGQERKLLPDDLLIWDDKQPVALAGIMGGLATEVRPTTRKVLLESANFKASRIRKTSVRLDLRTESAQRFEKSQPPIIVKWGVARFVHLLREARAEPRVLSRFTVAGDLGENWRTVVLAPGELNRLAGTTISEKTAVNILERLGFQAQTTSAGELVVKVPPFRSSKDISIPADIVEEILRIYGYDNIPPQMPIFPLRPLPVNHRLRLEHRARRLLAGAYGFVEVQTYGWMDDRFLEAIGYQPERPIVLKNPLVSFNRLMRTSLLPNLFALVEKNRPHRQAFRIFELGHVYWSGEDGQVREEARLSGLSFTADEKADPEEHFLAIKGAIEDLGQLLAGGPMRFQLQEQDARPWQRRGKWLSVFQGDRCIGSVGILDRGLLEVVSPEGGQLVWFELDMDALRGILWPAPKYMPPPSLPGSVQDFSLLWEAARGFAPLEEILAGFEHPLVQKRQFLYVYRGKGLPEGMGSYTFRFWIGHRDRTITSEEIESFRADFLAYLEKHGIRLR